MAEDTSAEDRTEEPTARRLSQATEEGESARSSEVTAAAVVIAATAPQPAEFAAGVFGVSIEEIATTTTATARRFFRL
jgi:flagellar biosynthetic protein FlhB